MSRRLALSLAAVACAAGTAAALRPETVLELENTTRSRVHVIPLEPGSPFSVTYHHSMYDQPVTEEFVLGRGRALELRAVSSPSAAVREYFGITGPGERHAVRRELPEIVFRVAKGAPQRLTVGRVERSFLTFGAPGDRLRLSAACRPELLCALLPRRPVHASR